MPAQAPAWQPSWAADPAQRSDGSSLVQGAAGGAGAGDLHRRWLHQCGDGPRGPVPGCAEPGADEHAVSPCTLRDAVDLDPSHIKLCVSWRIAARMALPSSREGMRCAHAHSVWSSHGSVCRCVGWYHSHPHFAAHPSIIDIKNQVNQQHQYRWAIHAPLTYLLCPSWTCPVNLPYNQFLGDRS